MLNYIRHGEGLVWRGMRGAGRTTKNYFFDACRTGLFFVKTALMALIVIGSYLGYTTVTDSDQAYQVTFPQDSYALVSSDGDTYLISTPDGEQEFVDLRGSWVNEQAEVVTDSELVDFLHRCQIYYELKTSDSSRKLEYPQMITTGWIPNGIEYAESR